MWAITSYFNPAGFRSRAPNYRIFRDNLKIPLVTVELSFDGRFELTEKDADILVQISGGAVLWQKERLLNLALKSVPAGVDNIVWIDGDVIFERSDWVEEAERKLAEFNVVQLLSDQVDLAPEDHHTNFDYADTPASGHGVVSMIHEGRFNPSNVTAPAAKNRRSFAWGLAWAGRRHILEEHGFYDAMIVGGATRGVVSAMYGDFDKVIEGCLFTPAYARHYLDWARPFHAAVGGKIGFVPGRLYHLWHGEIENRNYAGRYRGLADCNFDPYADLVVGSNGVWQWARPRPDLEKFLMDHFISRAEDG
ncbi:MAG: hypothetical protein EKK40_15520 [Bradyrhizobiaceae bacterium]|nr:MAG: hypothetical protein EKK40_15520 [Bradyrhizobiaceae bacterium]